MPVGTLGVAKRTPGLRKPIAPTLAAKWLVGDLIALSKIPGEEAAVVVEAGCVAPPAGLVSSHRVNCFALGGGDGVAGLRGMGVVRAESMYSDRRRGAEGKALGSGVEVRRLILNRLGNTLYASSYSNPSRRPLRKFLRLRARLGRLLLLLVKSAAFFCTLAGFVLVDGPAGFAFGFDFLVLLIVIGELARFEVRGVFVFALVAALERVVGAMVLVISR